MSTLLPGLNISGSSTVVANAAIDTINSAITAFTKNNILLQASQSMLAQSNSVPQSILSLLQ